MSDYHHSITTAYSYGDLVLRINKRAKLPLTGEIVEVYDHENGAFVMFEVDERWGFGKAEKPLRIGVDLEALEVES